MGIGGAALYALALKLAGELRRLGMHVAPVLRRVGREILDGTALSGAAAYGMPHMLDAECRRGDDELSPADEHRKSEVAKERVS